MATSRAASAPSATVRHGRAVRSGQPVLAVGRVEAVGQVPVGPARHDRSIGPARHDRSTGRARSARSTGAALPDRIAPPSIDHGRIGLDHSPGPIGTTRVGPIETTAIPTPASLAARPRTGRSPIDRSTIVDRARARRSSPDDPARTAPAHTARASVRSAVPSACAHPAAGAIPRVPVRRRSCQPCRRRMRSVRRRS